MLESDEFKTLVRIGNLFAIDLIVRNDNNEILIGKRNNSPAKGYWFVPGGRVYKNETLPDGLARICKTELGLNISSNDVEPIGLYDHIYEENYFEESGFGTHYIVLGIEIKKHINKNELPLDQHSSYKFIKENELLSDTTVHSNTKSYFLDKPENLFIKLK